MRPIKVRLILPLPSFILEILQSRISSLFGFRVANLIRNYLYGYTNLCKELMLIKLFFIILGRRDVILPASSFSFNFLDSFYYLGI